jgi:sortase A
MTLLVSRQGLRRMLHWAQLLLFVGAASLLGYWGFVQVETWFFQRDQEAQLVRLLETRKSQHATVPVERTSGLIGRLEIPRLSLSVMVVEGDSDSVLRHAAGHIPGTTLPGSPGNVGISAHRDTFFRPLRNIRMGDEISFATLAGDFRYHVTRTTIVNPSDVAVLAPSGEETLTLVTCYPFYFVGSAPHRFIVRAERSFATKE